MNSTPAPHNQEHEDLVHLYAIQALPLAEVVTAEAQIAACPECRKEMEMLRPVVEAFVSWPTDVLRPAASLWERVADRIAKETGMEPVSPPSRTAAEPEWEEAAPGISVKLLSTDTEKKRVSMVVRLAPGTDYPPHRHAGVEELHLLQGELMIDDRKLYPGDYVRAEADSVDHRVWSDTGCTCILLTSIDDDIVI